ncbi:hypothetical protein DFP73DRAFT_526292 [Morchella snyderi]|nr:hypothetical protein DFP73DRAFT_526292 [Morchella snyderi]
MAQLSSPHKAVSAVSTQNDTPELGSSPRIKMEPIPESCVDPPPPDYQPTCTSNAASTFSKISTPPLAQLTPVLAPSFTAIYTPTSSNAYTCINSPTPIYPLISTLASSTTTPRRTGRQGRATKERTLVRNTPIETVNYPCHEGISQFHRQKLLELSVYPIDGISNYSRSIPFKGAKESFLKSTGRSRFDVFEYRFTAPNIKGEEKNWWVMWDYYNGLVRVHDFFDCCKPGKTEPGNAVKEKINPGLQSICHNITGGNLHAQGYWIPYPAAKALATKFCFRIRYALTIIFGEDFPSLCLPESHPNFGKYSIDLEIIESCKETSAQQFVFEKQRASTGLCRPGSATLSESRPKVLTPVSNIPASDSCRNSSAIQAQKSGQTVGYQDHVYSIPASDNNGGSSDIQVYKSGQTGRYYDTARGIWTLGGANRNCSPLENTSRPVNSSALAKISTGTIFKSERAPKLTYSGAFGGNVTTRKTPTVPLVGQRTYMQMPGLPATGHYYFNESCYSSPGDPGGLRSTDIGASKG